MNSRENLIVIEKNTVTSFFKNAISSCYRVTKQILTPTGIVIGRIISSSGQTLFNLRTFLNYVTGNPDHPVGYIAIPFNMTANIVANLFTRAPAIYDAFSEKKNPEPKDKFKYNLLGNITKYSCETISFFSLFVFALSAYLGGLTLFEFILKNLLEENPDDAEWKENFTHAAAGFVAISNMLTYFFYNLKKANYNSKMFAQRVQERHMPSLSDCLKVSLLSAAASATVPFLNYFSTSSTFAKINIALANKHWSQMDEDVIHILSSASAFIAFGTYLLTNIPAVYNLITKEQKYYHYSNHYPWEGSAKLASYISGAIDAGNTSISNLTGLTDTTPKIVAIDSKNPYLVGFGIVCASTTGILYFCFSTRDAIIKNIHLYHEKHDNAYPTEVDATFKTLTAKPPIVTSYRSHSAHSINDDDEEKSPTTPLMAPDDIQELMNDDEQANGELHNGSTHKSQNGPRGSFGTFSNSRVDSQSNGIHGSPGTSGLFSDTSKTKNALNQVVITQDFSQ